MTTASGLTWCLRVCPFEHLSMIRGLQDLLSHSLGLERALKVFCLFSKIIRCKIKALMIESYHLHILNKKVVLAMMSPSLRNG
jgi:hypothetical protein